MSSPIFSQAFRAGSVSFDFTNDLQPPPGPQLEQMLSDLRDTRGVVASWVAAIKFSSFPAPLLEKIDIFSMELVQAETFISDQKATSVLDINPLLQKKHELWGKILRRFHNIKEEHMPLIERFLQRAVEEAAAEVAEEENQERKAKMQKVNATEEVSSGDEEVEEEEPKVNEEGSFTGEDLREDAQPFVGEEPIEPGFVK